MNMIQKNRVGLMALAFALTLTAGSLTQPTAAMAQVPAPEGTAKPSFHGGGPGMHMMHGPGEFWKNSETVKKLNLSDAQVADLDKLVTGRHERLMLLGQAMETESTKLQGLLNTEHLDDALINAQVEQVLAARAKMEREFTKLLLETRKVLTIEQWRQVQVMFPMGDHMKHFRHGNVNPGAAPVPMPDTGVPEGI